MFIYISFGLDILTASSNVKAIKLHLSNVLISSMYKYTVSTNDVKYGSHGSRDLDYRLKPLSGKKPGGECRINIPRQCPYAIVALTWGLKYNITYDPQRSYYFEA